MNSKLRVRSKKKRLIEEALLEQVLETKLESRTRHRQNFRRRYFHFHWSTKEFEQDPNAFLCWKQSRHEGLKALKWALRDLNRLSHLDRRIEGDNFFLAGFLAKIFNHVRIHHRNLIAEPNHSLDAGGIFDLTVLFGKNELRKQVTREHRLNEPDRASAGWLAKADTRCEAHHL